MFWLPDQARIVRDVLFKLAIERLTSDLWLFSWLTDIIACLNVGIVFWRIVQ